MTNTDKALLLAEWSARTPKEDRCPVCGRNSLGFPRQHGPDCVMDLALSERGFCTQEERDRGRAFAKGQFAPTLPPPTSARSHGDSESSNPNFDADPDDGGD